MKRDRIGAESNLSDVGPEALVVVKVRGGRAVFTENV